MGVVVCLWVVLTWMWICIVPLGVVVVVYISRGTSFKYVFTKTECVYLHITLQKPKINVYFHVTTLHLTAHILIISSIILQK